MLYNRSVCHCDQADEGKNVSVQMSVSTYRFCQPLKMLLAGFIIFDVPK